MAGSLGVDGVAPARRGTGTLGQPPVSALAADGQPSGVGFDSYPMQPTEDPPAADPLAGLVNTPGGVAARQFFQEHAAAIGKLSEAERSDLFRLVSYVGDPKRIPPEHAANIRTAVGVLVDDGRLLEKDTTGKSILGIFSERIGQKTRNGGGSAWDLGEIICTTAWPISINQGARTSTCSAAVVQAMMARQDPANYARFATGLVFDGQGVAPSGETVKLSTTEKERQKGGYGEGRGSVIASIQGSLIAHARQYGPGSSEDAYGGGRRGASATYGGGRAGSPVTYGAGRGGRGGVYGGNAGDAGLSAEQADYLRQRLVGESDAAKGGLAYGIDLPDGRGHAVLVTGLTPEAVQFWDPADGQLKQVTRYQFDNEFGGHLLEDAADRSRAKRAEAVRLEAEQSPEVQVPSRFQSTM